jgi:hypothetical protein
MKLLFLIIFAVTINTSEPIISGYVYDKQTNEELCGVRVTTNNDTTYTDFNGYFEIKNIKNSQIKFELISYEKKDTIIINDKMLTINTK